MKIFLASVTIMTVLMSKDSCHHKEKNQNNGNSFKGKLEVKGMCMNYTIAVVEGNIDTSLIESKWIDETTGKPYKNVFALKSRCTFPQNIAEGDEFTFIIDTAQVQNCAVCLGYYPTPAKHLSIKVLGK
ncbi:MAG: hypothetical protein QM764_24750 [Chitinophagaceae bacterium]